MIREFRPQPTESDLGIARELRDLAEKLESGEVTEIVVVANLRAEGCYQRMANFDDCWKLLGALEYAKQTVHNGMD